MVSRRLQVALLGMLAIGVAGGAQAADPGQVGNARAGHAYAIRTCTECHDVNAREDGPPPTVGAPNFHAIANAKTSTAMGLSAFLMTPHPTMPNLIIRERNRHDVIAYIMSLRDEKQPEPMRGGK